MTKVEKYISDLLHFHDCVIVPGLGGFVTNYKASSMVEERNLFLPPSKEIGFNRSLSHSDGLLIDYIARQNRLPYPEASVITRRFVDEILTRIKSGEIIDMGDIGTLKRDAIGNIQFTPGEGTSFLPDALGLVPFRFEPLETKKSLRIDLDEQIPRLLRSRSPRYWVAAASLITALFLFSTELKMPGINEAALLYQGTVPVISNDIKEGEIANGFIIPGVNNETDETENVNSLEEIKSVIPPRSAFYHVVAASFKHTVQANNALDQFLGKGFTDAKLIDDNQGRIRVVLASYINKNDALEALTQFRQKPGFENAWVLYSK